MPEIRTARTSASPEVVFLPRQGRLHMQGECFPSRPPEFFAPIVCTLQHHFETQRPARFDARLQLLYVSRGASACLHQLFALFDEAGREGTQVRVHWAHDAADPPHASSGPSWRVAWPMLFERQALATPGPTGAPSQSAS
jgi:hypothetical protein